MQDASAVTVTGVGEVEGRRSARPSVLPILNRGVRGVRSSADMLYSPGGGLCGTI